MTEKNDLIERFKTSNMIQQDTVNTAGREIVTTRLLDAPPHLVFDVWTKPDHVINWWGPKGFTNTIQAMNVQPGGIWCFIMHGPDGTDYDNKITYIEVVRPERLVYLHGTDIEDDPSQFQVTVTFEPHGDKTFLTMRALFKTVAERDFVVKEFGAIEGGNQTLDKLEQYLSSHRS